MAISISFLFGVLGNVTTGLIYLSSINTFWRIVKRKATEDFESFPYISKLLNAWFWTYYGIVKPNSVVVATVNGFGAVMEIVYIILFLMYSPPRMKVKTAILAGVLDVVFPGTVVLCAELLLKRKMQIEVAGYLSAIFSMVAYASPLSAMKTVVSTKSVEFMPFPLSFILFINGGVWTVYAVLVRDLFIGIPNGTGFVLGSAQLILYGIYMEKPNRPSQAISGDANLEDGSQHQPLLTTMHHSNDH